MMARRCWTGHPAHEASQSVAQKDVYGTFKTAAFELVTGLQTLTGLWLHVPRGKPKGCFSLWPKGLNS